MHASKHYAHFWRMFPCLFAIIVDYMGLGLVYPIVTEMFTQVPDTIFPGIQSLSTRDFFMGLSYVLYPLFMFFGASFLGDLSDRFGRKKILLLAMVGILISFLIMSVGISSHSIFLFLLGRAASGLMAGSQPLCLAAIADLSTQETKAWNMSLVTLTNCVGLVFGPFIAGVFTQSYFLQMVGFPFPFLIAAALALIGFLLIALFFKETFKGMPETKVSFLRPITIFIDAFEVPRIMFLLAIAFLQFLGFMLFYQLIGVYFREQFSYSSATLGFYYAFVGVFFALGVFLVIPYALKKWKIPSIAAFGYLLCGVGALLAVIYRNPYYSWVMTILYAIGNSIGFTAFATVVSNAADANKQGWVMGVLTSTVAISYVLAGFSTNLLPLLGSAGAIALGGVLAILSGLLQYAYNKIHP